MLRKLERHLDALGRVMVQWWAWPVAMFVLGIGASTAAFVVYPGDGEEMMLLGYRFGQECDFKVRVGFGCPGCGMTRSWVYTARGQLIRAMGYNPAGSLLFLWLAVGAPMGAMRLILRRPGFLRLAPPVFVGFVFALFLFTMAVFIGRMFGVNPLP